MRSVLNTFRQLSASLRMLLIFTVIFGVAYPLLITVIAQIPGLKSNADGSQITQDGKVVGSSLLGQGFTDSSGNPLPQYFQSRPSSAGAGYDPTASSPSNLGPESIVDTLPDPSVKDDAGKQSLLTQVCTLSLDIGKFDGVDGARPFCSPDGTGSVLAVFWSGPGYKGRVTRVVSINQGPGSTPFISSYKGVPVQLAKFGEDYSDGQVVPIRGDAPADPAVPSDAVTTSGSGLDPAISPAYAKIQESVVAKTRGITVAQVQILVSKYTSGRPLGFMGESTVNVLELNLALDAAYPYKK
ncbi:MAG TPA: potassium-transporting ATPase subunit C [Jatrophihabitantaceae bacterium]|nr:potassium-transporting ATPase subunit C [Jatrophihabitantaceae bacterium]